MRARASAEPELADAVWSDLNFVARTLRRLALLVCSIPDTGWFGLTPLRTHVLICGCPRSGSTMLQLMMEAALPRARRFSREIRWWRAATSRLRNHEIMITKRPRDIFDLDRARAFYRERRAQLRAIITIRDPRDVLTSSHPRSIRRRPYHSTVDGWRKLYPYLMRYLQDPDALIVRYEDLVSELDAVEARIEAFVGERIEHSFSEFYKVVPRDFDTRALNGVRPVDRRTVGRWQMAEHKVRIEEILREVPDFPRQLVDLGYENDYDWISRWRRGDLRRAA